MNGYAYSTIHPVPPSGSIMIKGHTLWLACIARRFSDSSVRKVVTSTETTSPINVAHTVNRTECRFLGCCHGSDHGKHGQYFDAEALRPVRWERQDYARPRAAAFPGIFGPPRAHAVKSELTRRSRFHAS